jgi:hypothetical protein
MVLIKATEASEAGNLPSQELLAAMGKYNEELVDAGVLQGGEGLHPTSTAIRIKFVGDQRQRTGGPFPNPSEQVAGFWLWKVDSMEEAVHWIERAPFDSDTTVELRRIFEPDDFGENLTVELREKEEQLRARASNQP